MKNRIFAHFARAFFIFWHFEDVLVLSTTWNDLFCSCVDDVSIWWQMFNFVLCPKRWFQFNSRIVGTHFSSIVSLNNWKMIAETRSHIFKWRSCFRRRRVCLSSHMSSSSHRHHGNFFIIPDVRLTCSWSPVIITDVAISAPYAGDDRGGVVYIYFGTKAGIETSPRQVSS